MQFPRWPLLSLCYFISLQYTMYFPNYSTPKNLIFLLKGAQRKAPVGYFNHFFFSLSFTYTFSGAFIHLTLNHSQILFLSLVKC